MNKGGASSCHWTLSDSDTSGCFGTKTLNRMSNFSDDPYASDVEYEADLATGSECGRV